MLRLKWHDILLLAISLILVLATTIYVISIYPSIPNQIIMQIELDGTTNTGSKSNILLILGLEWIMAISMIVVTIFPKFWNTKKVSMKNAMKSIFVTSKMLELTTLGMVLLFSYATLNAATVISFSIPVFVVIIAFITIVSIVGTVILAKIK